MYAICQLATILLGHPHLFLCLQSFSNKKRQKSKRQKSKGGKMVARSHPGPAEYDVRET